MYHYTFRITSNDLLIIIAIVCAAIVALVFCVAVAWARVRKAQIDADLKRDMLDRGLSPEEIDTVLEAGARPVRNCASGAAILR
jgi:hypothetical protein